MREKALEKFESRPYIAAGSRLRCWMKARNIKVKELSDLLGESATQASISQWKMGTGRPKSHIRSAIESLTGIDEDAWLRESEKLEANLIMARISTLRSTEPVEDDIFQRLAGRANLAS